MSADTPEDAPVTQPPGPSAAPAAMEFSFPDTTPARARRTRRTGKRRLLVPVATGAVMAVGVGAAFAAYQFGVFGAPGDQPAVAVPATAFAYAAVDFNPSAKEKIGAYRLAKKFPSAKITSKDSVKDDLLGSAFGDQQGISYDHDIKPWIGDRAAVAALPAPGTADGYTPLAVIAVKDQGTAKTDLAKIAKVINTGPAVNDPAAGAVPASRSPFVYAFKGDYVLISDSSAELDAAVAAKSTLDKDPTFTHDMDALGGDQFARAWVNADRMVTALPTSVTDKLPPAFAQRFTGSIAVGAHAASDYLEVTGKAFGMKAASDAVSQRVHLAQDLPADANAAVELTGLGKSLAQAWDAYKESDVFGISDQAAKAGFHLPDDLATVFGTDFAVAANVTHDDAKVMIAGETGDPAASKALLDRLAATDPSTPVTVNTTAKGYIGATDPTWLHTTHGLVDDPTFQKAVPDATTSKAFVYVDIASLAKAFDLSRDKDVAPLEAVGISATGNRDQGQFTARLTLK